MIAPAVEPRIAATLVNQCEPSVRNPTDVSLQNWGVFFELQRAVRPLEALSWAAEQCHDGTERPERIDDLGRAAMRASRLARAISEQKLSRRAEQACIDVEVTTAGIASLCLAADPDRSDPDPERVPSKTECFSAAHALALELYDRFRGTDLVVAWDAELGQPV